MRYGMMATLVALCWSGAAGAQTIARPLPQSTGSAKSALLDKAIKKFTLSVTYTILDGWNVLPVSSPEAKFSCGGEAISGALKPTLPLGTAAAAGTADDGPAKPAPMPGMRTCTASVLPGSYDLYVTRSPVKPAAPGMGMGLYATDKQWGGACEGTKGIACKLEMDGNKTVTANLLGN